VTIIDFDKQKQKQATTEFKTNLNKMINFCNAALNVVSSKDILLIPQNDEGMKKLQELLKVCKEFTGSNK
jgi:hypothetical protein